MEQQLKRLQQTQIEILKAIDDVCQKNGLHYSLYAGTLLGAVRHKGFIPWDDDLDICMPREDYKKFIEIWSKINPDGYIFQNKDNTPKFPQSFTKIRKEHTTFLQSDSERGKYHTGIFVDIFPVDRIPNGKIKRALFTWNCMRYQLYTREFIPDRENILVKSISKVLLLFVPPKKRPDMRSKLEKKIARYDNDTTLDTVFIETMSTIRVPMPARLLDEYVMMPYDGSEFMCFKMYDEYLTLKYNNYMQLPPKEERIWKHHPIIIDFERNYEELKEGEQ